MVTFIYEAMNQSGKEVNDEVEGDTTQEALARIRRLGYFPTRIREKNQVATKHQRAEPMRVRVCPSTDCGHQNQPNAKHCARCGDSFSDSTSGSEADRNACPELSKSKGAFPILPSVLLALLSTFFFVLLAATCFR